MKTTIVVALCLLTAPAAAAEPAAARVLESVDDSLNRWEDQFFKYEMIDVKPGEDERRLKLNVYMKGDKRVTEFTHPADVDGTRILILSNTRMYVYLPAYKKVRRIASHVTSQGFLGTTYASDDLAVTTYGDKYVPKMLGQDDKTYRLELVKKDDIEVAYPKIVMRIEKARRLPVEMKYFNEDGVHIKTESRGKYVCKDEVCVPTAMKMVDETSQGHTTHIVSRGWKVDSGIPDRVFTRRYIQRGR